MTRLLLISLICGVALVPQTKVDWPTQVKNGPVYDVRTYGAKGDGVADDTRAIQLTMDAVKKAGGGSVFFPKGTFRYVETARNYSIYMNYFTNEGSNVTVFGTGDGSVIRLEGDLGQGMTFAYNRAGWNVNCTRMDDYPASCDQTSFDPKAGGWPQMQRFQPARQGSKTITLVNGSAGSLFTPGMDLRLHSGENAPTTGHAPQHFEYNQVQSVSGGVITLTTPLEDYYDLQDSQWPPFVAIMTVLPKNIVIRDLMITRTTSRYGGIPGQSTFDGLLFNPASTRNVLFERVHFLGVGDNSAWWNTTSDGLTVKDCILENLTSDLGDYATNVTFDHNVIKYARERPFNVGSAFRNYRVTNNHFMMDNIGCCSTAIAFASAWKPDHPGRNVVITGNTVTMADAQYGCLVGVTAATDVLISGNTITGPNTAAGDGGHCGIYVDSSSNVRVTNNMVKLSGSQTVGINIISGSLAMVAPNPPLPAPPLQPSTNIVVEGNSLAVDHYGIQIQGAESKAVIGCNQIMGAANNFIDYTSTYTIYKCLGDGPSGPLGWYNGPGGSATTSIANLANHQYCAYFIVSTPLEIGHIVIPIDTPDAGNGLDVGIYGPDNKLIAHTGALNLVWPAGSYPWPSKPLCARNPANELESCGGAGSPIKTFKIPAGRNWWCYLQGQTQFRMATYANGAGLGGIGDVGLNSGPGNCYPGADGSCSPYVLRPQMGNLEPYYSIGNTYPIIVLTP